MANRSGSNNHPTITSTPSEISEFLRSEGIRREVIELLLTSEFDGKRFFNWGHEEYKDLTKISSVTSLDCIELLSLKRKATAGTDPNSQLMEHEPQIVRTRPFGKEAEESLIYTQGDCLPNETGDSFSLTEPAREFKSWNVQEEIKDMDKTRQEEYEKAFVQKRIGKFIIGAMNRRCNATIFFGIADSHQDENLRHGQIRGLHLSPDNRDTFETWMTKHFTGKNPLFFKGVSKSLVDIIKSCIYPLRFIKVANSENNQYLGVMELDVRPTADLCQNELFYCVSQKGKPNKNRNQTTKSGQMPLDGEERLYYLREGNSTNHYKDKRGIRELTNKVKSFQKKRMEQEREASKESTSVAENLERLLCRNRSNKMIDDKEFVFLLINAVQNTSKGDFAWINEIHFSVIIDLQSKLSNSERIDEIFDSGENTIIPKLITPSQLSSNFKDFLHLAKETLFERKSLLIQWSGEDDNWYENESRNTIRLMEQGFSEKNCSRNKEIVAIILLDESSEFTQISSLVQGLRTTLSPDQFVVLSNDKSTTNTFKEKISFAFSNRINEYIQIVDWATLNRFVCDHTGIKTYSGKKIVTNDGMKEIWSHDLKYFRECNLDVLASNECEEVIDMGHKEKKEFFEKAKEVVFRFLKGGDPDWTVFFLTDSSKIPIPSDFPPGLVERDITDDIVKQLKMKSESKTKCVQMVKLAHHPGSGATTIGKHVLWKLRTEFKCVCVNGNLIQTEDDFISAAGRIVNLRAYGEPKDLVSQEKIDQRCKTVLFMLDNSNEAKAEALIRNIQYETFTRNIIQEKAMFLCLHLVSSPDLSQEDKDSVPNNEQFEDAAASFKIIRTLSQKEESLFSSRLNFLTKEQNITPSDILHFVIIAQNFDDNSEYVKGVVENSIMNMEETHPEELKMLLYLSVLKYFCNGNYPKKTCLDFAEVDQSYFSTNFRQLSHQTREFLREDMLRKSKHPALEVLHVPVAFQLFKVISEVKLPNSLCGIVTDMLDSEIWMKGDSLLKERSLIMRELLTKRQYSRKEDHETQQEKEDNETQQLKGKFSNIINKIKNESWNDAVALLEKSYNVIPEEYDLAFIAQTLARIHYLKANVNRKDIEKAKEWAQRAVTHAPNIFTMYDTLGRTFSRETDFLIEELKSRTSSYYVKDCGKILSSAKRAKENYKKACEVYQKNKIAKGKNPAWNEDNYISDEDVESATNTLGFFGQIDISIKIYELIRDSKDLQKNQKVKKDFVGFFTITERREKSLSHLFPEASFLTSSMELHNFVLNLGENMQECLFELTKKMGYFSTASEQYNHWLEKLEKHARYFDKHFGQSLTTWKNVFETTSDEQSKLMCLRKHLALGLCYNFGWLIRKRSIADSLSTFQDILLKLEELKPSGMTNWDKLCYMNVAFALQHINPGSLKLSVKSVKSFCIELVEVPWNHPEPYLFFIMLNFPTKQDSKHLGKTIHCISKLRELESYYSDQKNGTGFGRRGKPIPIFFLKEGEDMNGIVANSKNQAEKRQRFVGCLTETKNVSLPLGKGQDITIDAATLEHRRTLVSDVSFLIGFAFSGPRAYGIKPANTEKEAQRLQRKN